MASGGAPTLQSTAQLPPSLLLAEDDLSLSSLCVLPWCIVIRLAASKLVPSFAVLKRRPSRLSCLKCSASGWQCVSLPSLCGSLAESEAVQPRRRAMQFKPALRSPSCHSGGKSLCTRRNGLPHAAPKHLTRKVLAQSPAVAAMPPFHLAFPVHDVEAARHFYEGILGCTLGRSATTWQDFSLFGHQIVAHEVKDYSGSATVNPVDGDPVPVPHYGLALTLEQFHVLAERVRDAGVHFEIEPHVRFSGQPGTVCDYNLRACTHAHTLAHKVLALSTPLVQHTCIQKGFIQNSWALSCICLCCARRAGVLLIFASRH